MAQTATSPAFAQIHALISCSTQATAFAEIRRCFGKTPCRSSLQIVDRESPVRSRTTGKRSNLNGLSVDPVSAAVRDTPSARVSSVRSARTCGSRVAARSDGRMLVGRRFMTLLPCCLNHVDCDGGSVSRASSRCRHVGRFTVVASGPRCVRRRCHSTTRHHELAGPLRRRLCEPSRVPNRSPARSRRSASTSRRRRDTGPWRPPSTRPNPADSGPRGAVSRARMSGHFD